MSRPSDAKASRLFLGLDGGKSKTVCLIATGEGEVVGWGRAGNSDDSTVPFDTAVTAVVDAVGAALVRAGVAAGDIESACFGLAGVAFPEDAVRFEKALRFRVEPRDMLVCNDALVALRAASMDRTGIVISAGTHLSVAVGTSKGETWFSGWASVDGPGGAEAGRRTMWAVLHAADGRGPATALTGAVADATGEGPDALLRRLARDEADEPFLAGLAPLLFKTEVIGGDAVARDIIAGLGQEMATWVLGLRARFDLRDRPTVYLSGGLFRAPSTLLIDGLARSVHRSDPAVEFRRIEREPVVGAVLDSMARAGIRIDEKLADRVVATGPKPTFYDTASLDGPDNA
jgi:N-acetylglucosamine kinase-like BadF-type ATPase